jgi:hypothetical protein
MPSANTYQRPCSCCWDNIKVLVYTTNKIFSYLQIHRAAKCACVFPAEVYAPSTSSF